MLRKCLKCGLEFEGRPDATLCRTCANESIKKVVLPRTCIRCGATFPGYPRSQYCPNCSVDRKKELDKAARERKRNGTIRHIGSVDICAKCGGEYTVAGGQQKYCPECAPEAIAEADRAQSRKWNAANLDYDRRRQDRQDATAYIKCAVCGTLFQPNEGAPVTCSPECAKKYAAQSNAEWYKNNREYRNEYTRNRIRTKIEAMTPEELAEYRAATNARARENYRKRKEKQKENTND